MREMNFPPTNSLFERGYAVVIVTNRLIAVHRDVTIREFLSTFKNLVCVRI